MLHSQTDPSPPAVNLSVPFPVDYDLAIVANETSDDVSAAALKNLQFLLSSNSKYWSQWICIVSCETLLQRTSPGMYCIMILAFR
jgi:hypothetical protein